MISTRNIEAIMLSEIRKLPSKKGSYVELGAEECQRIASLMGITQVPVRAIKNSHFVIQIYEDNGRIRISVQRTRSSHYIRKHNRDTRPISWEELQALKSDSGFPHRSAVEIYPSSGNVVNVANMRHLWIVDDDEIPFAWSRE